MKFHNISVCVCARRGRFLHDLLCLMVWVIQKKKKRSNTYKMWRNKIINKPLTASETLPSVSYEQWRLDSVEYRFYFLFVERATNRRTIGYIWDWWPRAGWRVDGTRKFSHANNLRVVIHQKRTGPNVLRTRFERFKRNYGRFVLRRWEFGLPQNTKNKKKMCFALLDQTLSISPSWLCIGTHRTLLVLISPVRVNDFSRKIT